MEMPEHQLVPGRLFIKGIVDLGTVLGYRVEQEFPVEKIKMAANQL